MAPCDFPALALEYESVLKRGVGDLDLSLVDIDDFIEYLCSRARLVQIYFHWRPTLPDPDDDRISGSGGTHRITDCDLQRERFS